MIITDAIYKPTEMALIKYQGRWKVCRREGLSKDKLIWMEDVGEMGWV